MKHKFIIVNSVLGFFVFACVGVGVWQYGVSRQLSQDIQARKESLKQDKSTIKRLDKLRQSPDIAVAEKDIFAVVPVGDMKALGLAKNLKAKVRALQLENFTFGLGDLFDPANSGAPKVDMDVMQVVPLKVTITFESQFPQIMMFLKYIYDLPRFVAFDRIVIERNEGVVTIPGASASGGAAGGYPAMGGGMAQPFMFPDVQGKVTAKKINQKTTIVLTTYTFTK